MAKKEVTHLDLIEREWNKYLKKFNRLPRCKKCEKEINQRDFGKVEYIKNKRGDEYFLHRECIVCGL